MSNVPKKHWTIDLTKMKWEVEKIQMWHIFLNVKLMVLCKVVKLLYIQKYSRNVQALITKKISIVDNIKLLTVMCRCAR